MGIDYQADQLDRHFRIEREKQRFLINCKKYMHAMYWKKGRWFSNLLLKIVKRSTAAKIVIHQVRDVYNHDLHKDYKIDILYHGRVVKGIEMPDYRIRLKSDPKIEFIIEGIYP